MLAIGNSRLLLSSKEDKYRISLSSLEDSKTIKEGQKVGDTKGHNLLKTIVLPIITGISTVVFSGTNT